MDYKNPPKTNSTCARFPPGFLPAKTCEQVLCAAQVHLIFRDYSLTASTVVWIALSSVERIVSVVDAIVSLSVENGPRM